MAKGTISLLERLKKGEVLIALEVIKETIPNFHLKDTRIRP